MNVSLPQQNNVSKPEEQLNLSVTKKTETGRYSAELEEFKNKYAIERK